MRLPNAVFCVKGQRKATFAKFCSKNSIKKQLVVSEYHTFLFVFTRIARNVINLSSTLTTVSENGFVVNKPLLNQILQKVYKTNETSNPPQTHVIKLVSTFFGNLFVPKTRIKNSWLSQSVILFSLYSHELLETNSV